MADDSGRRRRGAEERGEAAAGAAAVTQVESTVERFLATAGAHRAWGAPVTSGEVTVLPAAEVVAVLGFGAGHGGGRDRSGDGAHEGSGGGGGGGGSTLSRAVAAVEITPGGVEVHPVVDVTKIALAALTAGGFIAATLLGLTGPKKLLRQLRGR